MKKILLLKLKADTPLFKHFTVFDELTNNLIADEATLNERSTQV